MFQRNSVFPSTINKLSNIKATLGLEISFALAVKFILLTCLWWFFFAGKKQIVDEETIAGKFFSEHRSVIVSQEFQEDRNDRQ